jgi:hypothetical protein
MPLRFSIAATHSPNGRPMQSNGTHRKCRTSEFAELSDEAAEPYTGTNDRSLQCDAHINRTGASL